MLPFSKLATENRHYHFFFSKIMTRPRQHNWLHRYSFVPFLMVMFFVVSNIAVSQPTATLVDTNTADGGGALKGALRLGAEMQYQTGNIDRFMFRANATGDLQNSSFGLRSSLTYSLHRIFGMQLDNDWFGFADLRAFPKSTVFPIVFAEFETSNLRFLDLRVQGGVGAGVNLVQSQLVNVSLSATFTYDQTRFRIANSYEGWRYSFYLYGNYVLFDGKVILTHNFFSQPTALLTSNYRHRLIALVMIPISPNLSISSTFDYSYESVVDETRKPTNIFQAIGLTWNF